MCLVQEGPKGCNSCQRERDEERESESESSHSGQ